MVRWRKGGFAAYALLAAVLVISGCERTRISDINNDPGRYMGKDITVAGEVVNSVGALNQGAFEIDDGTGRLWVMSTAFGVPKNVARVAVTGRIQGGVTIGNRSIANVLRETKARRGA